MIIFHQKKISRPPRSSGLRMLIGGTAILTAILLIFGVYSLVRKTARRISADYYFPFLKAAQTVENTVAEQRLLLQNKRTLVRALLNLMQENAVLTAERTVVSDLKKENAELRTLLQLNQKGSFRPVFAEVMSRNPMNWQEQFIIDKGSRNGIEPGNLVVSVASSVLRNAPPAAVIGRVKTVSEHTAKVFTWLSPEFKMSVSLPETGSSGILEKAQHPSGMWATLKILPPKTVPVQGQLVCTNSFSGNNPQGLPVGRIVSTGNISPDSPRNQLYLEAVVQPFESPAEIRFVAVFVREKK